MGALVLPCRVFETTLGRRRRQKDKEGVRGKSCSLELRWTWRYTLARESAFLCGAPSSVERAPQTQILSQKTISYQ